MLFESDSRKAARTMHYNPLSNEGFFFCLQAIRRVRLLDFQKQIKIVNYRTFINKIDTKSILYYNVGNYTNGGFYV